MKINKFLQFIKEEFNDTPEQYISIALMKIKKRIDRMFEDESEEESEFNEPQKNIFTDDFSKKKKTKKKTKKKNSLEKAKKRGEREEEEENKLTLKDLGVKLESSEISKYSKLYDSLTVKFSDDESFYSLIIIIDLKEGIPKDPNKDFSANDISKCYIKFKKYDIDTFDIIGQLTKNVEIKKINEDFLINLKIELDDEFGDREDEFKIKTED